MSPRDRQMDRQTGQSKTNIFKVTDRWRKMQRLTGRGKTDTDCQLSEPERQTDG